MSQDRTNVREQEWAKNCPDYLLAAIEHVVGARDDIRDMLGRLNHRESTLTEREQVVVAREQIVGEREHAITKAAEDMKQFANQIYGPESELAKVNRRLEELPTIRGRVDAHDHDISELKSRVTTLEQRKTG